MEIQNENLTQAKFNAIDNDTIKRVVLGYVNENGYIKGEYGYHNNNYSTYRSSPTVLELTRIFDEGDYGEYLASEKLFNEMNDWVDHLDMSNEQLRGYFTKGKEMWDKNHVAKEELSLLASFCNTFIRNKQYQQNVLDRQVEKERREREHQEKVSSESNKFAGNVGDVVEFELGKDAEIERWIEVPTYYGGSYPVWKLTDINGLVYTWSDTQSSARESDLKVGTLIKGKIKKLNEFRGVKTTQIWKVEFRANLQNRLGKLFEN